MTFVMDEEDEDAMDDDDIFGKDNDKSITFPSTILGSSQETLDSEDNVEYSELTVVKRQHELTNKFVSGQLSFKDFKDKFFDKEEEEEEEVDEFVSDDDDWQPPTRKGRKPAKLKT